MTNITYVGKLDDRFGGIYRIKDGELILGKSRYIYIQNGNHYLEQLKVYADGMVDCWELISLGTFKKKLNEGWFTTVIDSQCTLDIHMLGEFEVSSPANFISPNELIKELEDIISELNGMPTSLQLCRNAYYAYMKEPNILNKKKLRIAYCDMPEHMRAFVLGDMDTKDSAITSIINEVSAEEIPIVIQYGRDNRFVELYKQAITGEIAIFKALVPLEEIKPFSDGKIDVSDSFREYFYSRYKSDDPIPLHVYQNGAHFVMSDNYLSYALYKEMESQFVLCYILGEPSGIDVIGLEETSILE